MKPIAINPKYLISEDGLVIINTENGRQLKPSEQLVKGKPSGYIYITLCFPPYTWKRIAVHRLVALTYLDPPADKQVWVNHKDGNKGNNHYTNLEWTTISENIKHSFDKLGRTMPKGEGHWLHGRKASKETKEKMRGAKMGVNHPKFKGYYIVNYKKYSSTYQAQRETGINAKTIYRRCKMATKDGFYFVPCKVI